MRIFSLTFGVSEVTGHLVKGVTYCRGHVRLCFQVESICCIIHIFKSPTTMSEYSKSVIWEVSVIVMDMMNA